MVEHSPKIVANDEKATTLIAERANNVEIRPEEKSGKADSCREKL